MEFRYVYRRVEDAIGHRLEYAWAPHTYLTQKLRHDFRESYDIARQTELTAQCLSAMAGNSGIDVSKANSRVVELINKAFEDKLPYIAAYRRRKKEVTPADDDGQYAEYFKYLKELEEKKKRNSETKEAQDTAKATS